ncbi:E3 ubiquitin-protein ligase SDIR1-like [Magnolia sinica]|uniref:E3 ubiquitin-protein ligase SDIR1-like n=1 Tax=Magnolia sinica TaxID=86752 RepID=UPI00265A2045|nr:E3 ubiquitin-protein ligase SDIR1-like [Magnolia sinica]
MNFILQGNRTDVESGIPESVPERRVMTGLGIVALVTITVLKIYAICHGFLGLGNAPEDGDAEFQLNVPRSITRGGRLQRLRLQLDLVDQEIDDYDYEEVDVFPGLTDQELNALPVLQYRIPSDLPSPVDPQRWLLYFLTSLGHLLKESGFVNSGSSSLHQESSSMQDQASSSTSMTSTIVIEKKDSPFKKYGEDELMCSICLEDVESGELVRHLPCLHQFHVGCIDMWLRQKAVCPICKSLVRYYHLLHRTNRGMARLDV